MAAIRHIRHRPVRRPTVVIGADVGGTWVRVVARGAGKRPLRVAVRTARVRDLRTFLLNLWKSHGWTSHEIGALVVAARGMWTLAERRALAHRLGAVARRVRVVSDAQAALLGALDERPGVLILSGTGSIVIGRDGQGRWARAGGMGPLLGDEGSAFWLGREWLRATTAGEDFWPVRRLVRSADPVAGIAALAPRVLQSARRGDRRARRIVKTGQAHLAAWTRDVARRLRLARPVALSWAGSVLDDPWFRAGVRTAVSRTGLRARWQEPAQAPVEAAARLAERLAALRRRPQG
jgi:N-acetylglucosamine kinase-like BadF-type ATPase